MSDPPPKLDHESTHPKSPRPLIARPIWFLISGTCFIVLIAAFLANSGELTGWPDLIVIAFFVGIGLMALINALRPGRR